MPTTLQSARATAHLSLIHAIHDATGSLSSGPSLLQANRSASVVPTAPAGYKEALWTIVIYASQVRGYQLPILGDPSKWPGGKTAYDQLQITWANTTANLQSWSLSSLRSVLALPQQLLADSDLVVLPGLRAALEQSAILIQNPNDSLAKIALRSNLRLLSTSFEQYSAQTTRLVQGLQSHAPVFDTDARLMNTIADNALAAAGNQRHAIEGFNREISKLNSEITAAAVAIAGGSFVSILGIGMGILAIVLAPATGGVSLTLLVPAAIITAGGAVIIGLNAVKIQQAKDAIEGFNRQIDRLGGDILLVNAMSTTLRGFAGQVNKLKDALSVVIKPWQEASVYLSNTEREIDSLKQSEDWRQLHAELNQIVTSWTELMKVMKQLEADAKVAPDSKLQLGMDEAAVRQQMTAHPEMTLIQYLAA